MLFKKTLNVAFIGNYLPRICGIATFTTDLCEGTSKRLSPKSNVFAIAVNDTEKGYNYPQRVIFAINQGLQKDYIEAANIINTSNAQVVCLQHEFGIFGGWDGVYILSLISKLNVPIVTTFHTVLNTPGPNQKKIMQEICQRSSKVIVMSSKAVELLKDIYAVPNEKIEIILHGTPDFPSLDSSHFKKRFQLSGKNMLLTFGLLSPNKGIETVLLALPEVIEEFPDLTYVVLGKTHPNIIRDQGEKYRNSLIKLVEKLRLKNHVIFDDRFVSLEELYAWLMASDIYLTPYLNKAQIVSGTLSYALSAGNAIISTPYLHAQELLADGRGILIDTNNTKLLSAALKELLHDKNKLKNLQKKAYAFGRQMTWDRVSKKYIDAFREAARSRPSVSLDYSKSMSIMRLPLFNLAHVKRLTDDTGMIQHAKYIVPDRKSGYCLDDNARALMLCASAVFLLKDKDAKDLLPVYYSFMHYMQKENGWFRNFLDYKRDFIDEDGSDDSNGRAIWALGCIIWRAPKDSYRSLAVECFRKAMRNIPKLNLRGKAFALLGLSSYLRAYQSDEQAYAMLKDGCGFFVEMYERTKDNSWKWFENIICYDNAIIPMALFNAYSYLKDEKILNCAVESLSFLEDIVFDNGRMSIVGNNGWYKKGGQKPQFDQQPIDAAAMILAFQSAYRTTRDTDYLEKMRVAFDWFLGDNDIGLPLYDSETGGCADGLAKDGVSMNQGAESTISFLMALLAMMEEYEIENV